MIVEGSLNIINKIFGWSKATINEIDRTIDNIAGKNVNLYKV